MLGKKNFLLGCPCIRFRRENKVLWTGDNNKEYSIQRYQDEPRLIKRNDDINTDVTIIEDRMSEQTTVGGDGSNLVTNYLLLGKSFKIEQQVRFQQPMHYASAFFIFSATTMPSQALHQNNRYKDSHMMLACHIQYDHDNCLAIEVLASAHLMAVILAVLLLKYSAILESIYAI